MSDRHASKERNKIINRCSADLEKIINGHKPEVGNLNNDIWDRLDAMAVEIEGFDLTSEGEAADDSEEEAYQIGKREGYDQAVQDIDLLTGGDGEYRFCTDHHPDRHTPDAETMKQRIVDRFTAPQPAQPDLGVMGRIAEILEDDFPNKDVWKDHASQDEWIRGKLIPTLTDARAHIAALTAKVESTEENLKANRGLLEYTEDSIAKLQRKWQFQLERADVAEAKVEELTIELTEARSSAERQWTGWVKEEVLRKTAEARVAQLEEALEAIRANLIRQGWGEKSLMIEGIDAALNPEKEVAND